MALYDGFFDAELASDGSYDRSYESGDFTGYFANIIGSGVCVHNNPDSFKAEYENGTLYLRPGYLFIRGYWLANQAGEGESNYKGYAVTMPADMAGPMAVVAHLNLGQRMIEINVQAVSQAYPDALVLAIVTDSAAEDTRYNTDLCGVIDTAGELSAKVEWALHYIDNEIEGRLDKAEADIAEKSAEMDAKIAEVSALVAKLAPPPVGTIKFTASQNVDADWLPCDGSFINEADYPDLVAALGKLIPSGDKFQLLSSGEVPQQISNGVLYAGRMWVYSYSSGKLYGIDVEGTSPIKEVTLTSTDSHFGDFLAPTVARPICLSIVPHTGGTGAKLFLAQIIRDGETGLDDYAWMEYCLMFQEEFTGSESSLSMSPPFTSIKNDNYSLSWGADLGIPYVSSFSENGTEKYIVFCGGALVNPAVSNQENYGALTWTANASQAEMRNANVGMFYYNSSSTKEAVRRIKQRVAYTPKNSKEAVGIQIRTKGNNLDGYKYSYSIHSGPYDQFGYAGGNYVNLLPTLRNSVGPINIVGDNEVVSAFDKNLFPSFSRKSAAMNSVSPNLHLPSSARVFIDAAAYLWGKSIYMFFVGTGIIFSRTLEAGSFGYLDTTSVLGTITQFGYLDYSQDEGTLYLLGQDTQNRVKLAKIVLNTLYDYANDGAWLPQIASDGVPAYIKAKETGAV